MQWIWLDAEALVLLDNGSALLGDEKCILDVACQACTTARE